MNESGINVTLGNYKFLPDDILRKFYVNELEAPHELLHAIDRELKERMATKVDMESLDKRINSWAKK